MSTKIFYQNPSIPLPASMLRLSLTSKNFCRRNGVELMSIQITIQPVTFFRNSFLSKVIISLRHIPIKLTVASILIIGLVMTCAIVPSIVLSCDISLVSLLNPLSCNISVVTIEDVSSE